MRDAQNVLKRYFSILAHSRQLYIPNGESMLSPCRASGSDYGIRDHDSEQRTKACFSQKVILIFERIAHSVTAGTMKEGMR